MGARKLSGLVGIGMGLALAACGSGPADGSQGGGLACAPDNGGMELPDGFCAVVVADEIGQPRHLTVAPNGDVYVALNDGRDGPGAALALRDTTGDGVADVKVQFADRGGTGVALWNGWVYVGRSESIVRYRRPEGQLEPDGAQEVIVSGLPGPGGHRAKPVQIAPDGTLYTNIGAPSNACQQESRSERSSGMDPCEQREVHAAIWRFDGEMRGQTLADGERVAAGMRNTVALRLHPEDGDLYAVIHGRDQLQQLWPDLYTAEESAELPAEELVRVREGDDYGWPYCYHDQIQGKKVLAPEYGGNGDEVGRCADMDAPLVGFPGHWAPNDLVFYHGEQFPARYRGGAFIAFHGSWNRAPKPQEGANVVFLPRGENGVFDGGAWEVFAEGEEDWANTREHRPTGLAVGPDGSLYISDDAGGRIWRVIYRPEG